MAKIGVFSDLHGDKANLQLIVDTLKQLGIDSALFLGDAVYETMSDFTRAEATKAHQLREQLRQDSQFRKDVMNGLFSDSQLERLTSSYELGKTVGKKVARAEYQDLKSTLGNIDTTILGGNWDYREEIADVFGTDFLNGTKAEVLGISVLGLSGGGSPSMYTAMSETLADDSDDKGARYQPWDKVLLASESLSADVLISHLPTSDGEGVQKENGVEHLKNTLKRRKQMGLDVPLYQFYGHRHECSAKYDNELEAFLISPGSCSSNHNSNLPTFMVAEFDDQHKLIGVDKYGIFSGLANFSEVHLVGSYNFDAEHKKVDFTAKNEIVFENKNLTALGNNLSLDDNYSLTRQGLNVNYAGLDSAEKDLLVRKNILIMFEEIEVKTKQLSAIVANAALAHINPDNKLEGTALELAITKAYANLASAACADMGISGEIRCIDEDERYMLNSLLINAVFGISASQFNDALRKSKVASVEEVSNWGSAIAEESSKKMSNMYQQHILGKLKAEDWQSMAELYIPEAYERKKELSEENDAFNLWLTSYKQGIISSEVIGETGAYKKKENFIAKKRTKEEVWEKFGLNDTEEVSPERTLEENINNIPPAQLSQLKEKIASGEIPVLKDDKGDYLPGPEGKKFYFDDAFKKGLNYVSTTIEDRIKQDVLSGNVPVIKKEGKEYLSLGGGKLMPFEADKYGLTALDYAPLEFQDYHRMQRDGLIRKRELELEQLRNSTSEESPRIILPNRGGIITPDRGSGGIITP